MPEQAWRDSTRVVTAQHDLTQQLGRQPTLDELGAAVSLSDRRVRRALEWRVTPESLDLRGAEDAPDPAAAELVVLIAVAAARSRAPAGLPGGRPAGRAGAAVRVRRV